MRKMERKKTFKHVRKSGRDRPKMYGWDRER